MKKIILSIFVIMVLLSSCGGKSHKKRNLDDTLYKYASLIRWSNFDGATTLLKKDKNGEAGATEFEVERLKQFKVSQYLESPIRPGNKENIILQNVKIQLYNIHTNKSRTIHDRQTWEFNSDLEQWYLTTGLPKL